ncbi:hypothetical protein PFISCL1PPCAC_14887, partial [Pristionchus fissidentatus]
FGRPMECTVCNSNFSWEDGVQLIPCLHMICIKCYESMCKFSKTCPFPYCFSPLRLNPDLRLNKCESPNCRRRMAPVGELIMLDCDHSLCGECHGELFRGRRAAFCPECDSPVAADGEESCEVCSKFGPAEKMMASACCGAKICMICAERGRKDRIGKEQKKEEEKEVKCPEGKCPAPKKKKKRGKDGEGSAGGSRCSCGLMCENEPLPNFPSENECEHEVCLECLGKTLEANEKSKLVPCCPNEMCRQPYRSESVLALRVLFPERKGYFDMFEVGYHFGFEKLKDEKIIEIEYADDFDSLKRMFNIKACVTEDEEGALTIEFDRKGTFGDLLREARKALKIGVTDKVYGYYLRIDGEDKVIVISHEMIQQDLATAGVLRATMVMVDMSGIVSANRHVAQPASEKK